MLLIWTVASLVREQVFKHLEARIAAAKVLGLRSNRLGRKAPWNGERDR